MAQVSPPESVGNIILLGSPPKTRELDPMENAWQFLRDNRLFDRVLQSSDEIVTLSGETRYDRIGQPWKIMSIGHRKMST